LKSSWTGGSAPFLCKGSHNSGAVLPVNELLKRPSYLSSCYRTLRSVATTLWLVFGRYRLRISAEGGTVSL